MVKNFWILILIGFFSFSGPLFGQDRYAIHYFYKPQTFFSLESPSDFISQRAIDRRIKERISLDSTDLPVSPIYVEAISPLVERIYYHSKWLNASVVVATAEQVEELEGMAFIEKVERVGLGFYPAGHQGKKEASTPIKFRIKSKNTKAYEFQNDLLGIPAMHGEGFNGAGIMIAVFDAGFLNTDKILGMNHLFEEDRIVATKDLVIPGSKDVFRSDGHGTASLSVMASYEPSKLVGGAFGAQYILCITEDARSEYRIEEYNWVRGAEFADSLGVDIINSSLGYNRFDDPAMNYAPEDMDGQTAIVSQGATLAALKGILIVSSAGNEGNGSWETLTAPADAEGILTVGSVNYDLSRSSFSSIGPTYDGRIKPELVAFGSGVTVWRQIEEPNTSSGTSFTSPQIAALAAGLWQARPEWTLEQVIRNLLGSGNMADSPDNELGFGVPNFMDAYLGEILQIEEAGIQNLPLVFPNPLDGNELFIQYGEQNQCDFRMLSASGQVIADQRLTRHSSENPYEISLKYVLPGIYFIECGENNHVEKFKLIKR
jgi:subtilisin family serine protease